MDGFFPRCFGAWAYLRDAYLGTTYLFDRLPSKEKKENNKRNQANNS